MLEDKITDYSRAALWSGFDLDYTKIKEAR